MEYSLFKSLQALLFFGSAMGFCLWQLSVIRRIRRQDAEARNRSERGAPDVVPAHPRQAPGDH